MTETDEEEFIYDTEDEVITFNRDEIDALLKECKYSYISYENSIARDVISRMMAFINELDK